METKVQIVLCALLFINLECAAMTGPEPTTHPSSVDESPDLGTPGIPVSPTGTPPSSPRLEAAGSDSIPGLDSPSQAGTLTLQGSDASADSNSHRNVSLTTSNDTATATVELASVTPPVQHLSTAFPPGKQDDNRNQSAAMDLSAIPTLPAKVGNPTEQSAIETSPSSSSSSSSSSHSLSPSPSGTHSASPQLPLTATTISITSTVLTSAPDTHNTTAPPKAVPPSTPSHTSSHATSPSSTSLHAPKSHTTTPAPPAQVHPTEMTVVTTSRPGTTSTSSDTEEAPHSRPPPPSSAETTVYSGPLPQTSTFAHPKYVFTPPPAQAHADSVGGDATVVHESPTLDPLLAGLVSAFIVTAVIITLLLFLKLRRRDNRPEFRRLQDLPMDDMMEDTPLSMYSY